MISGFFDVARPLLLAFDPERAHEMSLRALERGMHPRDRGPDHPRLAVAAMGLDFPNPVGIAAGFDKDARVPDAVLAMGCGFAEIGTVTPLPQVGNPRPRIFRLIRDRAVINRLGFNNHGHQPALGRLAERASNGGIVGVNIGANKDSLDRDMDYVAGLETFSDVASYFTVNISSPNTPGLRDLQAPDALAALLEKLMRARASILADRRPARPIVVKLAPDIASEDLAPIVAVLAAAGVDGIAVSNTTLRRDGLADGRNSGEAGGLSGRPLFALSTAMLARVHQLTEGKIPLIGIGGIDSPERALEKIEAGASLIQLYTGLIYEGPGLIVRIKRHLAETLIARDIDSISRLTGSRAGDWAKKA